MAGNSTFVVDGNRAASPALLASSAPRSPAGPLAGSPLDGQPARRKRRGGVHRHKQLKALRDDQRRLAAEQDEKRAELAARMDELAALHQQIGGVQVRIVYLYEELSALDRTAHDQRAREETLRQLADAARQAQPVSQPVSQPAPYKPAFNPAAAEFVVRGPSPARPATASSSDDADSVVFLLERPSSNEPSTEASSTSSTSSPPCRRPVVRTPSTPPTTPPLDPSAMPPLPPALPVLAISVPALDVGGSSSDDDTEDTSPRVVMPACPFTPRFRPVRVSLKAAAVQPAGSKQAGTATKDQSKPKPGPHPNPNKPKARAASPKPAAPSSGRTTPRPASKRPAAAASPVLRPKTPSAKVLPPKTTAPAPAKVALPKVALPKVALPKVAPKTAPKAAAAAAPTAKSTASASASSPVFAPKKQVPSPLARRPSPKPSPKPSPRLAPKPTPKLTPKSSPKLTPKSSPKLLPQTAPSKATSSPLGPGRVPAASKSTAARASLMIGDVEIHPYADRSARGYDDGFADGTHSIADLDLGPPAVPPPA